MSLALDSGFMNLDEERLQLATYLLAFGQSCLPQNVLRTHCV